MSSEASFKLGQRIQQWAVPHTQYTMAYTLDIQMHCTFIDNFIKLFLRTQVQQVIHNFWKPVSSKLCRHSDRGGCDAELLGHPCHKAAHDLSVLLCGIHSLRPCIAIPKSKGNDKDCSPPKQVALVAAVAPQSLAIYATHEAHQALWDTRVSPRLELLESIG